MRFKSFAILMMGVIGISFPSCTGILGGLYDEERKDFGFIETWGNSGTIYLDCDSKKEWIYIDLKNRKYETRSIAPQYGFLPPRSASSGLVHLDVRNLDEWFYLDFHTNGLEVRSAADESALEPEQWDLAVHHHDFKTNGAVVAMTDYTSVNSLVWAFNPEIQEETDTEKRPEKKVPSEFVSDQTSEIMLSGGQKKTSLLNPVLGSWFVPEGDHFQTGKNVYAFRLEDRSLVAVKLLGFTDDEGVEGILSIQYTLLDENWRVLPAESSEISADPADPEADEPENWDFAIHRYDCKTNAAGAYMTDYTTFQSLLDAEKPADNLFEPDVPGYVLYNMSYMFDGAMIYVDTPVNAILNTWLDVDMSGMPPIYTPKKNIFLLKKEDGTYFALQLVKYGSGRITMNYFYPVEFN